MISNEPSITVAPPAPIGGRQGRKQAITQLLATKQLSDAGARWLEKALDPFHDFSVRVDGMPDSNSQNTVVQEYNVTQTFSVPTGVAGNWDAHIFNLPELNTSTTATTSYLTYPSTTPPSGPYTMEPYNFVFGGTSGVANGLSGLMVSVGPAGFKSVPDDNISVQAQYSNTYNLPIPSTSQGGTRRLIAFAYEIHDTTAQLYQQGTVTAYKMPQDTRYASIPYGTSATSQSYNVNFVVSKAPPSTSTQAILLFDARQWNVKDGAYVVCSQDVMSEYARLKANTGFPHLFLNDDLYGMNISASQATTAVTTTFGFGHLPSLSSSTSFAPFIAQASTPYSHPTAFDTHGVFLTGLNNQSTFTVTVRYLVEYAPSVYETTLVSLAQPSPNYDPIALELYQHASAMLPPAVDVGQNASGDWWQTCLKVLGDVAPIVGNIIPVPGAKAIGNAVGGASKMIANTTSKSPRRKPSPEDGQADEMEFKDVPNSAPPSQRRKARAPGPLRSKLSKKK
jgi:hypothetical protein